ncbi:nucleolar prt [Enterospora canceri]|uniref:Nucleolar prt n=1 Tax=Enterospora canceri TaxID=1081671 RepID=A0A1Y1S9E7_9MICR|nr:nucleolar prt [Enterospora canceri]
MFTELSKKNQKFYKDVASIVEKVNSKLSTIKREIYRRKSPNRFVGILNNTMTNYEVLADINKTTEFMENEALGCVLICDILNNKIDNSENKAKFMRAMGDRMLREPNDSVVIRLNTMKTTEDSLTGFKYEKTPIPNVFRITGGKENSAESIKRQVLTELDDLVKIQSFESCLPVHLLRPEEGSTVIDATAAPGNKTTHCVDLMKNTGVIHAYERDRCRFTVLKKMIKEYGATNTKLYNNDFLKTDPKSIQPDYVIVDPSCSGSGIHFNYKKDPERLAKLQNFQCMILNHALKFDAKRVVYSVCSLHTEEAEDVVKEALEKNSYYELDTINVDGVPHGDPAYEFSDKVLRVGRNDGISSGFFACVFIRKNK